MKRSFYILTILLTLGVLFPIVQANAQSCQPDEYYGIVASGNADAVVAENSISHSDGALGVPVLVPSNNAYYAKLDNANDYLVLDLTDTLDVGDTVWISFGSDEGKNCRLDVTATLTSTNYASGAGFFDSQNYTTDVDLNDGNPVQVTVPFILSTGSARYLRFTRWTGKPGVNGVDYSIYGCISAYPTAANDASSIYGEGTLNIDVQNNDSDPQGLSLTTSIVSAPSNGTAVVQGDNTIDYTHSVGYVGTDIFTYQVCNTSGLCDTASVSVVVTAATTISSGSYIINMGVVPQTVNNALKPYGLIYELTTSNYTPVDLVINPNKTKDGIDFSHNGTDYKGGPYIVRAEFIDATVAAVIASWEAQGVVGDYTVSSINVPVNRTMTNFMGWTLDDQNGHIAEQYILAAGIPSSAYNWLAPADLGGCNDVFVMPHADPTWAVHSNLLTWTDSYENGGSKGTIWAACHAVSALENLYNPADTTQQMNFLSDISKAGDWSGDYADNSLILWGDHNDGTLPYSYAEPTDPIMQFMGDLDDATTNGSEQIYLPHMKWSDHTTISVWDPDNPEISNDQVAAVVAYGYAFGDTSRGQVMYIAGHDHAKSWDPDNIASMRAFFNFSFAASVGKSIKVNGSIAVDSILLAYDETQITMTAVGGQDVNYTYAWYSSLDGYFTQPDSSSTIFVPLDTGQYVIRCVVSDDCGRSSFYAVSYQVAPNECSAPSGDNAIYGRVYQDLNANQAQDAWEYGLGDVTIHLYEDADQDGVPDGAALQSVVSDSLGDYEFIISRSGSGTKHYLTSIDQSTFPYGGSATTATSRAMSFHVGDQVKCYDKYGVDINTTLAIDDVNVTHQMLSVGGSVMRNDFDIEGDNAVFNGYLKQDGSGLQTSGVTVSGTNSAGTPVANAGTFTFNNNGEYTFDPQSDFIGEVKIQYIRCDDATPMACDTGSLYIEVSAFPNPSEYTANSVIPVNDYHVTYSDLISANVLDNDADPEMDDFHLEEFGTGEQPLPFGQDLLVSGEDRFRNNWSSAAHFTLSTDGSYVFAPASGFVGKVELEYRICDEFDAGYSACKNAKLTVDVMPEKDGAANDAPYAGDDYANTIMNTSVTGKWLFNDADDNGDMVKLNDLSQQLDLDAPGPGNVLASYTTRKNGFIDLYDNGTFKYSPPTDYYGPDQLAYRICDVTASPACDSATIYLLTSPIYHDFGDLPAQYPTAGHMIPIDFDEDGTPDMPSTIWFGEIVDAELASQGNFNADGDNGTTSNDEEGLIIPGWEGQNPGLDFNLKVIVNGTDPGMTVYFGLWIDWNFDGTFDEFHQGSGVTNDWFLRNQDTIYVPITLPGFIRQETVGIRLRAFQSMPDASMFSGIYRAGEVEDYVWLMSNTLPVELTYFDVTANGNDAILNWQTASEVNNDYFSVQRSRDAATWEEIDVVDGHGNSSVVHDYSLTDPNLSSGRYYYRLQQFDFDGQSEFSDIESIDISGTSNREAVNIYPNPARVTDDVTIDGLGSGTNSEVQVYTMDGSLLNAVVLEPDRALEISKMGLPAGMYMLTVINEAGTESFKLVIKN